MGVDAYIEFRARPGVDSVRLDSALPSGTIVDKIDRAKAGFSPDGVYQSAATHVVGYGCRYYGPRYPRGHWPLISAVLITLLNSPDIECVWYYPESEVGERDYTEPITPEYVEQMTRYFIKYGRREYFGDLKDSWVYL